MSSHNKINKCDRFYNIQVLVPSDVDGVSYLMTRTRLNARIIGTYKIMTNIHRINGVNRRTKEY